METENTLGNVVGGRKGSSIRNARGMATPMGQNGMSQTAINEVQIKMEYLERQYRALADKTMAMDTNLQHYGEAIEEVAKQVEASNRFTANRLYN